MMKHRLRTWHSKVSMLCVLLYSFAFLQFALGADDDAEEEEAEIHSSNNDDDQNTESYTTEVTYEEIYCVIAFLMIIHLSGKGAKILGMPALVGELMSGIIVGPHGLDIVPFEEAFVLLGEIGLIGMIFEVGLELDYDLLRQSGSSTIFLSCFGGMCALICGLAVGYAHGSLKQGFAVGTIFVQSAIGTSAPVLRPFGIFKRPVGQLLLGVAIVDDIIALIFVSILETFADDKPKSMFGLCLPVISCVGFLVILGGSAISILPNLIEKRYLTLFQKNNRDFALLFLMAAFTMAYLPLLYYTKSSYLIGSMLAGASFSRVKSAHEVFISNGSTLLTWLLKVFFGATIGFQVPVTLFQERSVIVLGCIIAITCVFSKLLTALVVPNFHKIAGSSHSRTKHRQDQITIGLSMVCRGGFGFVIASFALNEGIISAELYASCVFAILIATLIPPFLLNHLLGIFNKKLIAEHIL